MEVSDGQYFDPRGKLPVDNCKRKPVKQESASTVYVAGPALRGLRNDVNGLAERHGKSGCCQLTAFKIPIKSRFVFRSGFFVKLDAFNVHA